MAEPQDVLTYDKLKAVFDEVAKNSIDRVWGEWVQRNHLFLRPATAAAADSGFVFDTGGVVFFSNPTPPTYLNVNWCHRESPQAELPVEKEIGAIKAYRVWGWTLDSENNPALTAVVWGTEWTGPVMVADCVPENGTANGDVTKHHGLYATKDLRDVLESYDGGVVGEVALFGRVVEHEHGFRAEKAMIRRLVLLDPRDLLDHPTLDRDLAERYGCEVSTDLRTLMGGKS